MAYGSVLSSVRDSTANRKRRGAFFTPPAMARFICDMLVPNHSSMVLEPACGEGAFLAAAAVRLATLGASDEEVSRQLVGCELHAETVQAALSRLALQGVKPRIETGDFFSLDPTPCFDVVMGNPPYIRYQEFTGEQRLLAQRRAQDRGVNLTALASSWAPFVIHACGFLRQGGHLGMVLPAELMSTNYAGPVRAYLLDHFARIEVCLFERSVFPEVEEEVVVLLAHSFGLRSAEGISIRQHTSLEHIGSGESVFCRVSATQRWPLGEVGSQAAALVGNLDAFVPLDAWGSVHLGAVTGANEFFCLTSNELKAYELGDADVMRLCPAGSSHLRNLRFDEPLWHRLERRGEGVFLFYPHDEPSAAAQRYIELGEAKGLDQRYKCRTRRPWWRVPLVGCCDAFITYMNGVGPNLCCNDADAVHINSVHGLTLQPELRSLGREVLPLLYLSSLTQLSAEVYGRSYGGGVLKLEPREAARSQVPDAKTAARICTAVLSLCSEVERLLPTDRVQATRLVDELLVREQVVEREQVESAETLLEALRSRRVSRSKRG